MPWTTPNRVAPGDLLSAAAYNQYVSDNLLYLHSGRPAVSVTLATGGPYAITPAQGWRPIDESALSIVLNMTTGRALITGTITARAITDANTLSLDCEIDGVRIGGSDGVVSKVISLGAESLGFCVLRTGLSVGSHTFRLACKVAWSNMNILADSMSAVHFGVAEW